MVNMVVMFLMVMSVGLLLVSICQTILHRRHPAKKYHLAGWQTVLAASVLVVSTMSLLVVVQTHEFVTCVRDNIGDDGHLVDSSIDCR